MDLLGLLDYCNLTRKLLWLLDREDALILRCVSKSWRSRVSFRIVMKLRRRRRIPPPPPPEGSLPPQPPPQSSLPPPPSPLSQYHQLPQGSIQPPPPPPQGFLPPPPYYHHNLQHTAYCLMPRPPLTPPPPPLNTHNSQYHTVYSNSTEVKRRKLNSDSIPPPPGYPVSFAYAHPSTIPPPSQPIFSGDSGIKLAGGQEESWCVLENH